MKRIILISFSILSLGFAVQAQKVTDKVVLTKGQKISMSMDMNSKITQAQRGDMTSSLNSMSELTVEEITDKGYVLSALMKKAKMNFEGFGMKQEYDSENTEKQQGMMAKGFEKALKNSEKVNLGFDGKIFDKAPEKEKGGMGMMMSGSDISSSIEGAFLILPEGLEVGKKWRTTTENEGLKTITEYTFQGRMGDIINLTANQQVKGETAGGRGGMFTSTINQLTQMVLMVDANSSLVLSNVKTTKDNSITKMGGETYTSTGDITTTIICE